VPLLKLDMSVKVDRAKLYPERIAPRRWNGWAAGMIGIAALASLVVVVLLAIVLWLSVLDGMPGDPTATYTLRYYAEIFTDPFTYSVLYNTFVFSAITLVVSMAFGVPLAWLVERTNLPLKSAVFASMTIGLILPGFATAIGWQFLFHPRIGMVNLWLKDLLGLSESPFNIGTLLGMGWVQGLGLAGVAFVMSSVVFRSMDSTLEEAAHTSGVNVRQTLLRVTIPLAWPGVLAAAIYIFMIGFAAFDVPAIIGLAGNIFTFSTYAYDQVKPTGMLPEYGPVGALSMVMVVLGLLLSWWYGRVQSKAPRYAVVTGKSYRPRTIDLGRGKVLAVTFVVVYLLLAQVVPLLVVIWTSTQPFPAPPTAHAIAQATLAHYGEIPGEMLWRGIRNTAALMVLTPTITLLVSFSFSWVVLRSKVPGRSLFDFAAFMPHAVPNIVFSMAALLLALFVLRDALPIYGTIWILVLVYVVSRIAYATRITNSALIQIHKELEEAAQMSGAGIGGIVRSVLMPLLKPAMIYAWIWIALITYRELTLPVLLSSNDNLPLAVVVWNMWLSGQFGEASAVVVLMLAVMMPLVAIGFWFARRTGVATPGT
jgi:iron(III) transport system permease protein